MRERVSGRIWPDWSTTVGGLIDRGVIVRFVCLACREFFDVDLQVVAARRGRGYSLIDAKAGCKRSSCRGAGRFLAAEAFDRPFVLLENRPDLRATGWLHGLRPCDVDRPPDGFPPAPPVAFAQPWPEAKRA